MADITNTHENDVIFNIDSLREFIKLIKRQGTENIDFYAVSELLQPPGDNLMVSVPEGSMDGNLEPWINLYEDAKRRQYEEKLFEYFENYTTDDNGIYTNLKFSVYQYIPAVYERNYFIDENGVRWTSPGFHKFAKERTKEIKEASDIETRYRTTINYDDNGDETSDWTSCSDLVNEYNTTDFKVTLNYETYTKEDQYNMRYYTNLNEMLSTFSNERSIMINDKQLWIFYPIFSPRTTPFLYFVMEFEDRDIIISLLNNYSSYNKQIKIRKEYNEVKTYIKRPIDNPNNEPWWKFIYTKDNGNMIYYDSNDQANYYTEFVEDELKANPGKIVIVRKIHPWQNNITNSENGYDINIKSGRHLYVQAGSLLKFNPGQSTEDKDEIDDYWTDTTPGTFSIDENDGQKAHIITIRGFDQDGNFNNKNPIVGYTSQNDIPSSTDTDGAYKIGSDDYNLTPEQLAALQQQPDVPVYLDGTVIGYIKSKDIPKESDENGAYEINDQKYDLDPNLIIPLAQANIIPVYLNNNDASITSHEGNFDIINADTSVGSSNDYIPDGYFTNLHLAGNGLESSGVLTIINNTEAERRPNDPNVGNIVSDINNLTGSIRTLGGIAAGKSIKGYRVYAAVFNDYAECRKTINLEPGRVVIDNDDGSLSCANARLLPGAQVISDTYGNLIGEMSEAQTPIAVAGRVLVYTYQSREKYHAGMAVCSAPNGAVDIMTREEIREYPDCIIGIVSEIPNYEKWGTDQVDVNGRIWIKVK